MMRPLLKGSGRKAAGAAQVTSQPGVPVARRSQAAGGGARRLRAIVK